MVIALLFSNKSLDVGIGSFSEILIVLRDVQSEKTDWPRVSILSGNVISLRLLHPAKAELSIVVRLSGNENVLRITSGKIRIYCEMQDRAGNLENEQQVLSTGNLTGGLYCDRAVNTDHFVLLPDGTVVLCCNDYGMQHVLGNLSNQSYEDIVHGEFFLNVKRAMHIDESLPLLCRKCMYAKPIVKNVSSKVNK